MPLITLRLTEKVCVLRGICRLFFYFSFINLLCSVGVLSACVHHVHAQCLQRSKEDIESPGTGVTVACEAPCRGWESNPGPLQEQKCSKTLNHHLSAPP